MKIESKWRGVVEIESRWGWDLSVYRCWWVIMLFIYREFEIGLGFISIIYII